jgi:cytochrome c biogenesis protein CcmG, thiol:disulfide interchange protein DsbE
VGVNWSDGLSGARSYVHQYGWTFPSLRDSSGAVGAHYGLEGLPTTFILDPKGRIAQVLQGPQSIGSLTQALRSAAGS